MHVQILTQNTLWFPPFKYLPSKWHKLDVHIEKLQNGNMLCIYGVIFKYDKT